MTATRDVILVQLRHALQPAIGRERLDAELPDVARQLAEYGEDQECLVINSSTFSAVRLSCRPGVEPLHVATHRWSVHVYAGQEAMATTVEWVQRVGHHDSVERLERRLGDLERDGAGMSVAEADLWHVACVGRRVTPPLRDRVVRAVERFDAWRISDLRRHLLRDLRHETRAGNHPRGMLNVGPWIASLDPAAASRATEVARAVAPRFVGQLVTEAVVETMVAAVEAELQVSAIRTTLSLWER